MQKVIYGNEVLRIKSKKPDNIFDLRELFKFNLHFDSLIIFKLKNTNPNSHIYGNEVLRIKSKKPDNMFELGELFKFNKHFNSLIIFEL